MIRAIRRFVSNLKGKNKFIFFLVLLLICIMALCIGIYTQFFYKYSDTDPFMIGINIGSKKTAEEYAILESNFNNLFQNTLHINSENVRVDKIEWAKDLVYAGYNLVNEDENYYSVNAIIPVINIDTINAKKINNDIKSEFYEKANSVMRQNEQNIIYNVSYIAFVNQDILSVAVKSSLKEGNKPEKVTIKTYTYSLPDELFLSLIDLIELKKTTIGEVQKIITDSVRTAYNNSKIIAEEYGNVYERDLNSNIYKIENTKVFFLTQDGYVYVIYPYGNTDYTNEMDVLIF